MAQFRAKPRASTAAAQPTIHFCLTFTRGMDSQLRKRMDKVARDAGLSRTEVARQMLNHCLGPVTK